MKMFVRVDIVFVINLECHKFRFSLQYIPLGDFMMQIVTKSSAYHPLVMWFIYNKFIVIMTYDKKDNQIYLPASKINAGNAAPTIWFNKAKSAWKSISKKIFNDQR